MAVSISQLRVRFAETDQMGVAHHSAYVVWIEAARVDWLRERGISYRQIEDGGLSLAVSALEVRYRNSARFDDLIQIKTELTEAKSRRFRFDYVLTNADSNQIIATAHSIHTPTNRQGRAVRLPDIWLHKITTPLATQTTPA